MAKKGSDPGDNHAEAHGCRHCRRAGAVQEAGRDDPDRHGQPNHQAPSRRQGERSASSASASSRSASAPPAWAATRRPASRSRSRQARRSPSAPPRSSRKPSSASNSPGDTLEPAPFRLAPRPRNGAYPVVSWRLMRFACANQFRLSASSLSVTAWSLCRHRPSTSSTPSPSVSCAMP